MARINVDYSFYVENYLGSSIPAEAFPAESRDAEGFVNKLTFGRIHNYELGSQDLECVKMAICAVAESIWRNRKTDGIASENTDGYSVTYDHQINSNDRAASAAHIYLCDTSLLERRVNYDYKL